MSPRRRATRSTREQAIRVLRGGQDLVSLWCDEIRRGAEKRADSFEPADVVTDPAYAVALQLYGDFNAAVTAFITESATVEAGEVR